MNKKHFFALAAVAAMVAVAGCNKAGKLNEKSTQPAPSGPVALKLKWTPNERVVQNMDIKTKTEMNIPGQPAPMKQDVNMGQKFAMTVLKESPDGGHELEMEYLSARMGMEQAGKTTMNYDSDKKSPEDAKNPVAGIFGGIIGSKLHFFLDASNNVERVEGVEEMFNRISSGKNGAQLAPVKSMFSEGYFKQMMSANLMLPPNAVSPGDSWPVKMEFPMEMLGTLVLDQTFTLARWETHGKRNCARLEFQGTIQTKGDSKPNAMGMTLSIQNGNTTGVSWFDPELGIIIDSQMHQDMTMVIGIPKNPRAKTGPMSSPQTMTNQMNQELSIKLDSLNE